MPYLGSSPARGLVGTANIDATAVTTAKIAANAIDGTLTKDALIADYSDVTITASDLIMYGDATDSNNTKRDTVQGILDLAGGGAFVFIADTNCSGASSFEINDLSATYDNYFLIMTNVKNNNSVSYLRTTVGTSSSYASSGYYWGRQGVGVGTSGTGGSQGQNGSYFEFSSQGPTNSVRSYWMYIFRKSDGGTRCQFFGQNMGNENATWDESLYHFGGFIDTGSLIDDIKFEMLTNTGQITVSSARLYGIVNS